MLEIPIKTKFDGVETDVVVTVWGFRVLRTDEGEGRVVLDDYDVAYESGVAVPAEVLDGNDTLALAIEDVIEDCIVPGAAPEAISPEEDVATKLGKSAGSSTASSRSSGRCPSWRARSTTTCSSTTSIW